MANSIPLSCKNCDTHISAKDININKAIAKCPECDHVFSFEQDLNVHLHKPEVMMPKNIEVLELRSELNLYRKWWGPKFIGIAFFALFWNGFMVVWFSMAIATGAYPMALFGTIHAIAGLGMIYWVIAGTFNTTEVRTTKNRFYIKHGPIPWRGNREIEVSNISQFFTKMHIQRNDNSTTYSYELHAVLNDGKQIKILGQMDKPEEALYLEQELERFLDIPDRRVSGEFKQ